MDPLASGSWLDSPIMASESDVLVDASTIARSYDLVNGGRPCAASLFALSNLLDAIVLQGKISTLAPVPSEFHPGGPTFDQVLASLGLHPELLELSEESRNRIFSAVRAGRDLDFGVSSFDEDGNEFVPGSAVDPAAARLSQDIIQRDLRRGATSQNFTIDRFDGLQQSLGTEVKLYFRSVYELFHLNLEEEILENWEGRYGAIPFVICYLGFRSDLYLALSAYHDIPYSPDGLRTYLIASRTKATNLRIASIARTVVRRFEAVRQSEYQDLLDLGAPPAIDLHLPSILNVVLADVDSPRGIMDAARDVSVSSRATRIQTSFRTLRRLDPRFPDQRTELNKKLSELRTLINDMGAEHLGSKRGPLNPWRVSKYVLQGGVSVLGLILDSTPLAMAGMLSTLTLLSNLDPGLLRKALVRKSYSLLADPVSVRDGVLGTGAAIEKIFGSRLPDRELEVLLRLRALPI